ncbi:hypothetical protein B0J14DRAFT_579824 [Halenospora varia]|nr:hypothetical protein B0J14DRAFT_579824 [Halenospora varia]
MYCTNGLINSGTGHCCPSGFQFNTTLNPSMDWLSSSVLSIPNWTAEGMAHIAPTTAPTSSSGNYTTANDDPWNYFDASFKEVINPSPLTCPATDIFGDSTSGYLQNVSQSIPLSLVHGPLNLDDNDKSDETEGLLYADLSLPTVAADTLQRPRTASWGTTSKHPCCNSGDSKSERHLTRIKQEESKMSKKSVSLSRKRHQFRNTKPNQKINHSQRNDTTSTKNSKSVKTTHNLVEKQYRTRLNGQFSTLLRSLPPDVVGTKIVGYSNRDSAPEKKVSKAEVLVLAKEYIKSLERTKKALEDDKERLLADVQWLKRILVSIRGEIMP